MRNMVKIALGTLMLCGAVAAVTGPAAAQVRFGIGVAPAYVPAPSCYDVYGNYAYSYPYCTAYGTPAYVAPSVQFRFGERHDRGDHHIDRDRGDRGHEMRGGDRGEHRGR